MYQDNYFTGDKTEERRKAVAKTVHPISLPELQELGEKLFPDADHPYRIAFFDFLKENAGETFHQATTLDGINFVYCKEKDKGIWYVANGVGIMQEKGRKIMKSILAS